MTARFQPDLEPSVDRVLVVEDSPVTCTFIRRTLERVGVNVTIAATGERALELAAREPFDLFLLDLSSTDFKATEVCRGLRNDLGAQDIPVMFVTGETTAAATDEALRLGAVDVIRKPLQTVDFLARVLGSLPQQSGGVADTLNWVTNR